MVPGVTSKTKQLKILTCFYKPTNPAEMKRATEIRGNYVNYAFREFEEHGIVKCLVSTARTGRIFGLTEKGQRLRKRLIKRTELPETVSFEYREPRGLDWKLYGWVLAGKGKREYLKLMAQIAEQKNEGFKASDVFTTFRMDGIKSTPRTEVYRALKQFVRKGIVVRVPEGKRGVCFKLAKKGLTISSLLSS